DPASDSYGLVSAVQALTASVTPRSRRGAADDAADDRLVQHDPVVGWILAGEELSQREMPRPRSLWPSSVRGYVAVVMSARRPAAPGTGC
ncbi:MAG: hypothetical protein ACLQB1_01935, partial [Streptosporangiaceae bacterium]